MSALTDLDLLTEGDVAELRGMSVEWLRRDRWRGNGPPYIKTGGRRVVYRRADVEAWLDRHRVDAEAV